MKHTPLEVVIVWCSYIIEPNRSIKSKLVIVSFWIVPLLHSVNDMTRHDAGCHQAVRIAVPERVGILRF